MATPSNQGNAGTVSNAGNLGLSFGLGGLFVGTLDLTSDDPLIGDTDDFLQDLYDASTEDQYDDYSTTDGSTQTAPTSPDSVSSTQSFESQPSDSTIGWLTDSLVRLGAGTRPDIVFCANRFFWICSRSARHRLVGLMGPRRSRRQHTIAVRPSADAVDDNSSEDMPALIWPVRPSTGNDSSDRDDNIHASVNVSPILVDHSNGSVWTATDSEHPTQYALIKCHPKGRAGRN
jgi:hypothetical protein